MWSSESLTWATVLLSISFFYTVVPTAIFCSQSHHPVLRYRHPLLTAMGAILAGASQFVQIAILLFRGLGEVPASYTRRNVTFDAMAYSTLPALTVQVLLMRTHLLRREFEKHRELTFDLREKRLKDMCESRRQQRKLRELARGVSRSRRIFQVQASWAALTRSHLNTGLSGLTKVEAIDSQMFCLMAILVLLQIALMLLVPLLSVVFTMSSSASDWAGWALLAMNVCAFFLLVRYTHILRDAFGIKSELQILSSTSVLVAVVAVARPLNIATSLYFSPVVIDTIATGVLSVWTALVTWRSIIVPLTQIQDLKQDMMHGRHSSSRESNDAAAVVSGTGNPLSSKSDLRLGASGIRGAFEKAMRSPVTLALFREYCIHEFTVEHVVFIVNAELFAERFQELVSSHTRSVSEGSISAPRIPSFFGVHHGTAPKRPHTSGSKEALHQAIGNSLSMIGSLQEASSQNNPHSTPQRKSAWGDPIASPAASIANDSVLNISAVHESRRYSSVIGETLHNFAASLSRRLSTSVTNLGGGERDDKRRRRTKEELIELAEIMYGLFFSSWAPFPVNVSSSAQTEIRELFDESGCLRFTEIPEMDTRDYPQEQDSQAIETDRPTNLHSTRYCLRGDMFRQAQIEVSQMLKNGPFKRFIKKQSVDF